MKTNRLNQPTFVIPWSDELGAAASFARRCDRTGRPDSKGRFAAVTFGARVGALVAATPARERNAVVAESAIKAAALASAGQKGLAGKGRVDMVAYLARTATDAKALVAEVKATRGRLARPATRVKVAKAIVSEA